MNRDMGSAESGGLLAILTYNDGVNLKRTLERVSPDFPYPVLVHVDGSTDGSDVCLRDFRFPVYRNSTNQGIGASLKNVIRYARANGFSALCVLPGNGKNDPGEAGRLLSPILRGEADFVQGSRFLPGGSYANTPFFRLVLVRTYTALFSLAAGRKCSDALEGCRAYRLDLFDEGRIDIWQEWLNTYELETYLLWKVLRGDYRYAEAPTSKVYPVYRRGLVVHRDRPPYTHIRPLRDWWRIVRPLALLTFRFKD